MSALADKVVRVGTVYLGPASRKFMERQTKFHMDNLALDNLETKHLPQLARWVELSAKLLIEEAKAKLLARMILNAAGP